MIEFDGAAALFAAVGLATLAAALLPRLLGRAPVSMPMVFLAAGVLAYTVLPGLPDPDPLQQPGIALHLTEICVLVSLMGAGLALNRPIGWRAWSSTWRLLAVTMPLSMLAVGILGWSVLGLGAAAAVLLAAVPLAAEVAGLLVAGLVTALLVAVVVADRLGVGHPAGTAA
jgi:NhaP-type Na+/H+ or K+/H+ antiporter